MNHHYDQKEGPGKPGPFRYTSFFTQRRIYSQRASVVRALAGHLLDAVTADQLALEHRDVVRVAAENAARLIFLKYYFVVIDEYLDRILRVYIHLVAKLYREDYSSKFIDLSDDTNAFHYSFPCSFL